MKPPRVLEESLGVSFMNPALLEMALTPYIPYVSVVENHQGHNRLLSTLGAMVLETVVAWHHLEHIITTGHPETSQEGSSILMTNEFLVSIAKEWDLASFLRIDHKKVKNVAKLPGGQPKYLVDALKAVIGALVHDQGLDATNDFIREQIIAKAVAQVVKEQPTTAKATLAQRAKKAGHAEPTYTAETSGHGTWVAHVRIDFVLVGRGTGKTPEAAREDAARRAVAFHYNDKHLL